MVRAFDLYAALHELITDEGRDYGRGIAPMSAPQLAVLVAMLLRRN